MAGKVQREVYKPSLRATDGPQGPRGGTLRGTGPGWEERRNLAFEYWTIDDNSKGANGEQSMERGRCGMLYLSNTPFPTPKHNLAWLKPATHISSIEGSGIR